MGAVQLQQIKTGWPHGSNGQHRVNNKGRKLKKSPGNERRSERGGGGGGSASRTSEDQSSTDPGGGPSQNTQRGPPWQLPGDHDGPAQWSANSREFPPLGTQRTTGVETGPAGPCDIEMDQRPMGHPTPASRRLDGARRPARDIRSVPEGNRNVRTQGVQEPVATPLSPLVESFYPRSTSEEQQPRSSYMDNGLDRSLAKTGSSKVETTRNNIKRKIATIGKAGPIETGEPVAMADVAEPPGSAGTGAGGPVVAGTQFTAVADRTGASGLSGSETGEPVVTEMRIQTGIDVADASGSVGVEKGLRPVGGIAGAGGPAGTGVGGPVVAGTWFLAVADVHAPFEDREDDPQSGLEKFEPVPGTITEVTRPQPLRHADVTEEVAVNEESGSGAQNTDSDVIGEASDNDPTGFPFLHQSPSGENSLWDAEGAEDTAEGDAIMVGAVGSAAPWFLTGWANDVEVEFMIDTGCQVTILATSVLSECVKSTPS